MSELTEKYTLIAPRSEYLIDKVVLAQAWKKTHKYIRRYNWYADVLELDCSTINLEKNINVWIDSIKGNRYTPEALRIVPAPKNSLWDFPTNCKNDFNTWAPTKDGVNIRPLAHLNIRDQTLATAIMMCLADAVETFQGQSEETDFLKAQSQEIYSYGNRLHCEWIEVPNKRKRAQFGWGNSQIYRKFYEDYQMFLARPKQICQYYASKLLPTQSLFIISMDIKGFFDTIDKNALLVQLKKSYGKYVQDYKLSATHFDDEDFWEITKGVFGWKWENHDADDLFNDNKLPEGIPQGLVASGFLSNAYLMEFDVEVGKRINGIADTDGFILRDYCRYVDDMRLVVEVNDTKKPEDVEKKINLFVKSLLNAHVDKLGASLRLILNGKKTKVIPYRQLSSQSNVSSLMALIQNTLSGTPDVESLRDVAGGLDGLLRLSDQLENEQQWLKNKNKLELSRITSPNVDVRDDTLKRFAATRIVKSLRIRRGMTDLQESLGNKEAMLENVTVGQMLDHEFESTARKLISCWASNPSLTLLLRCGLDLFPDPILLGPVLEAIEIKLFHNDESEVVNKEVKATEYVVADLFRGAAVEIGYRQEIDYPETADIEAFRHELGAFAKRILTDRSDSPWYVKQQASLFLASIGDSINLPMEKELLQYRLLHEIMLYRKINDERPVLEWFPVAMIAQQLNTDTKRFAQWFVQLMSKLEENEQKELVHIVSMNRPDLLLEIKKVRRGRNTKWNHFIPREIESSIPSKQNLLKNEKIPLLKVISRDDNPFAQENALLLFAIKLLQQVEDIEDKIKDGLSVADISVECKDWSKIQHLDYQGDFLKVSVDSHTNDERYMKPDWVTPSTHWLYGVGRILRSCFTGEYDFTTTTFLSRENVGSYHGLRSTWYSRRFGLLNSPSGLLKEQYPVSPWLTELLIRLLQWPGIEINGNLITDFEEVTISSDLCRIIDSRIKRQKQLFGKQSKIPVYEIPTISEGLSADKLFRVAIVQTLLPKMDDFNEKDPTNWSLSFRAKHRAHIASVCNLVRKKLQAWCEAQNPIKLNAVDLIVFPELSVHPDDLWLLRRLSDATKASIFAGMTFIRRSPKEKPINQAIWILRSERRSGREFVEVRQGKQNMTKIEDKIGIQGHRPYQIVAEFKKSEFESIRVAGAICYDATDLKLVADLRDISDVFVVAALNKDVPTFDNMVEALHYHMYQPVILANTGEFGGSTAQAPFTKHDRLIAHVHGNNQIAISVFELDPTVFKTIKQPKKSLEVKSPPAGYKGRV